MTLEKAAKTDDGAHERDLQPPAKKLKNPGVKPQDSLSEAGRKVLRFHFLLMVENEPGTRLGEDIEALHDMRVATRRMRSAFDLFGPAFKSKTLRRHLRGLGAAGRALGRVRDLDVVLEKAGKYAATLPKEEQAGLEPLLDAWRQEREAARVRMLQHLDSPEYADFVRSFEKFLNTPGAGARKRLPPLVPAVAPAEDSILRVQEAAPLLIYSRLAGVRAFESAFGPGLENASLEDLHALRIEFKKFRYTLEFFREVLGSQVKALIEDLKKLQDHLGDLNDAHVAVNSLQAILADWDNQQAGRSVEAQQSAEAIAAYLAYRLAERHRLRQSFGEAWEYINRPEFRRNLALAVSVL